VLAGNEFCSTLPSSSSQIPTRSPTVAACGRCIARLARASLPSVITAIVLVKTAVDRVPDVAQAIAELPAVTEVYSVTGEFDLVAMVRVRQHEELAEVIPGGLNKVDGVLATETHVAFRTYSRHDLESAFSLGLGDS
jgi:DNA-binding Lrp family transcriptional regulator